MIVAIIMTVIAAISLIIALIPAIIMSTPIGFIWSGIFGSIALALFVFSILTNYLRSNIPQGIKEIFKEEYLPTFHDFIEKNKLTIQEIRVLLDALRNSRRSGDVSFHKYTEVFPKKLKTALNKYGISRFLEGMEQSDLIDLDSVLIKNCPLYWLKKFIQAAPEFPTKELVGQSYDEIASYWLGRSGCCKNAETIFSENTHLIAKEISREDFELVSLHIQNNNWKNEELDSVKHKISEACLEIKKQHLEGNAVIDVAGFLKGIENSLLELCVHGVSWEQLCLINSMDFEDWNLLCALDENKQGVRRFAVPCLGDISDEKHHLYEPMISLMTWQDIRKLDLYKKSFFGQYIRNPQHKLIRYFARQVRYHTPDVLHRESLQWFPTYILDFTTGVKTS
ncbi:DUF1389 domain-containing protein [Chlamydia sp. 12-01]|uniref:DUF1389 domain-containing protein n=1 Tax=Chlamydia sp. 12-01 TaxID=3002742 RepID=UPI0035D47BA7